MGKKSRILNPELFQGKNKKRDYFEGWYFKHTDKKGAVNFSIIPGINYEGESKSAFIQVITGPPYKSYYIKYDYDEFFYSDEPFRVNIGSNVFSYDYIELDIDNEDIQLKGRIDFSNQSKIDSSFFSPNIMGFFAYFRFMQCNHGVLSLNHDLAGEIEYNGKAISFDKGKGYMEKDWGTSFPKKYCWIQCNHFDEPHNSLFFSVAHIPFLGFEFMGFISILKVGSRQYRFATYNGAKVKKTVFKDDTVNIVVKRGEYTMEIDAKVKDGRVLKAPKNGIMIDDIKETLEGSVMVRLYCKGDLVYDGQSENAGVETVGNK